MKLNKEKGLLSIIVPVYNMEQYLDCCIMSIISQTYENVEIVLINDGSTDRSPELCDEYAEKYHQVRVIHKTNGGVASAKNAGLDVAKGEFITFMDSDDKYGDINTLSESMKYFIEIDNLDVVQFPLHHYNTHGERIWSCDIQNVLLSGKEDILQAFTSPHSVLSPSLCDKIFRKEVIYGLHFEEVYSEDTLYEVYALNKTRKLMIHNKGSYCYLHREGSRCQSAMTLSKRQGQFKLEVAILESLVCCSNLLNDKKNECLYSILKMLIWVYAYYGKRESTRLMSQLKSLNIDSHKVKNINGSFVNCVSLRLFNVLGLKYYVNLVGCLSRIFVKLTNRKSKATTSYDG